MGGNGLSIIGAPLTPLTAQTGCSPGARGVDGAAHTRSGSTTQGRRATGSQSRQIVLRVVQAEMSAQFRILAIPCASWGFRFPFPGRGCVAARRDGVECARVRPAVAEFKSSRPRGRRVYALASAGVITITQRPVSGAVETRIFLSCRAGIFWGKCFGQRRLGVPCLFDCVRPGWAQITDASPERRAGGGSRCLGSAEGLIGVSSSQ